MNISKEITQRSANSARKSSMDWIGCIPTDSIKLEPKFLTVKISESEIWTFRPLIELANLYWCRQIRSFELLGLRNAFQTLKFRANGRRLGYLETDLLISSTFRYKLIVLIKIIADLWLPLVDFNQIVVWFSNQNNSPVAYPIDLHRVSHRVASSIGFQWKLFNLKTLQRNLFHGKCLKI